jgi:uncharacterized protein
MLRVPLSQVHAGPVETVGEIAPDDPVFGGLEVQLAAPVQVSGRLSSAGEDKYYWRVHFRTVVRAPCRRCLADALVPVEEDRRLIFAADDETPEGEGTYLVPLRTQVLDLTEPLREEVFLAVPHFVECRADCKGLCPRCGKNLNDGPCDCPPEADSRWDALKRLPQADTPEKD